MSHERVAPVLWLGDTKFGWLLSKYEDVDAW